MKAVRAGRGGGGGGEEAVRPWDIRAERKKKEKKDNPP